MRPDRAESQIAAAEILATLRSDVDTRLATLLWPAFEENLSLSAELASIANTSVLELLHIQVLLVSEQKYLVESIKKKCIPRAVENSCYNSWMMIDKEMKILRVSSCKTMF